MVKLSCVSLVAPAYLTNGIYSNNVDVCNTKWSGAELTLDEKKNRVALKWKNKHIFFPLSAVLSYTPMSSDL